MSIKSERVECEYRQVDREIEGAVRWGQFWIALESRAVLPDMVADAQMEMARIYQSCKYLRKILDSYGKYRIADAVSMLVNRSPYWDGDMVQREINESRREHRDHGIGRVIERESHDLCPEIKKLRQALQSYESENREVACA